MNTFDLKDPREIPAYTVGEAAHYLGVPESTMRSWFAGTSYSHQGNRRKFKAVITPADSKNLSLSFSNLVEAYVLTAIRRKHRIGLPTIRKGLEYLTGKLHSQRPLLTNQFATKGQELYVELGQVINLSRNGQVEMAEMILAYLERVDRDAKGLPIKLYPFMRSQPLRDQPRTVVIDPKISFGRPVLAGTGIPTAVLAEQFKAGDQPAELAKAYGAEEQAVWDAIRCELDLEAA
ncbi:MAG: DUF433 domain-containing protein [Betaproteobacteria bacterium]